MYATYYLMNILFEKLNEHIAKTKVYTHDGIYIDTIPFILLTCYEHFNESKFSTKFESSSLEKYELLPGYTKKSGEFMIEFTKKLYSVSSETITDLFSKFNNVEILLICMIANDYQIDKRIGSKLIHYGQSMWRRNGTKKMFHTSPTFKINFDSPLVRLFFDKMFADCFSYYQFVKEISRLNVDWFKYDYFREKLYDVMFKYDAYVGTYGYTEHELVNTFVTFLVDIYKKNSFLLHDDEIKQVMGRFLWSFISSNKINEMVNVIGKVYPSITNDFINTYRTIDLAIADTSSVLTRDHYSYLVDIEMSGGIISTESQKIIYTTETEPKELKMKYKMERPSLRYISSSDPVAYKYGCYKFGCYFTDLFDKIKHCDMVYSVYIKNNIKSYEDSKFNLDILMERNIVKCKSDNVNSNLIELEVDPKYGWYVRFKIVIHGLKTLE